MQAPQETVEPHPPGTVPQDASSCAQVLLVQPHWLVIPPPPHTSGDAHEPQSTTSLHPSDAIPQVAPTWVQVLALQEPVPH